MTKEKKIVSLAKQFVLKINSDSNSKEIYLDMFEINFGNKEVLLNHLKAINKIISDAIKILEKENKSEKNNFK